MMNLLWSKIVETDSTPRSEKTFLKNLIELQPFYVQFLRRSDPSKIVDVEETFEDDGVSDLGSCATAQEFIDESDDPSIFYDSTPGPTDGQIYLSNSSIFSDNDTDVISNAVQMACISSKIANLPKSTRTKQAENMHYASTDHDADTLAFSMHMAAVPNGAPELPLHYVERAELCMQLIKRLRAAKPGHITAICGSTPNACSGIGKSILASSVIKKHEVRLLFSGGIYWLNVGRPCTDYSDVFQIICELAMTMVQNMFKPVTKISVNNGLDQQQRNTPDCGLTYQSLGLFTIEACCKLIREYTNYEYNVNNPNTSVTDTGIESCTTVVGNDVSCFQRSKFLLVLDDVANDRVVHFFQDLGFVLLITTRSSEVFNKGTIVGSLVFIDAISTEFCKQVLMKAARNNILIESGRFPVEATKLVDMTNNVLELSMLGAMAVERPNSQDVWSEIYRLRTQASATSGSWLWSDPNSPSPSQILHSVPESRHAGLMTTVRVSLDGLAGYVQDYYYAMVVLPKGVALDKQTLGSLWVLEDQGDFLAAILSLLVMRSLLTCEYYDSEPRYRLHDIQADFLLCDAVKQSMERGARNLSDKKGGRSLGSASMSLLQSAVDRMLDMLTDPVLPRDGDGSSINTFAFDCACWRRLEILRSLGLCGWLCPAEAFQSRIDKQMAAREAGDLFRFIGYACRILEHLGINHPRLITWYKTALDFLEIDGMSEQAEAASLMNCLGLVLVRLKRYEEAVDIHFKAVIILESILGYKHLEVAVTYSYIGSALKALGHVDDSIQMLRKSLYITIEVAGKGSPSVARSLLTLSQVLAEKGLTDESAAGFEAAISIFEITLGPNHPECILAFGDRGITLMNNGDYIHGTLLIERSLKGLKLFGFKEDDDCVQNLRKCLLKKGKKKNGSYNIEISDCIC